MAKKNKDECKLSVLEFKLLVIVKGHPYLSGREVASKYTEMVHKRVPYGSMYTTARRLKEKGFLTTHQSADDRRIERYMITAKGVDTVDSVRSFYSSLAQFGIPKVKA